MAYVIDENCVACGTCAAVCPEDAIYEGDIFEIDPEVCIGCGSCAGVCPVGTDSYLALPGQSGKVHPRNAEALLQLLSGPSADPGSAENDVRKEREI